MSHVEDTFEWLQGGPLALVSTSQDAHVQPMARPARDARRVTAKSPLFPWHVGGLQFCSVRALVTVEQVVE